MDGDGSVANDARQDFLEQFLRIGLDREPGKAGILPTLTDLDLQDFVPASQGGDFVEHLGENQAVDDVAGNLHVFDEGRMPVFARSGRHARSSMTVCRCA